MPVLKKLTIGGVEMSIDAGNFIKYDNNGIALNTALVLSRVENFNLPASTTTRKDFWTAPKDGIALLTFTATFATNATGFRQLSIMVDNNGTTRGAGGQLKVAAANTGTTQLTVTLATGNLSAGEVLFGSFYQNSGASLAMTSTQVVGQFITKSDT